MRARREAKADYVRLTTTLTTKAVLLTRSSWSFVVVWPQC